MKEDLSEKAGRKKEKEEGSISCAGQENSNEKDGGSKGGRKAMKERREGAMVEERG